MILEVPLNEAKKIIKTKYKFPIVKIDTDLLADLTCTIERDMIEKPLAADVQIGSIRKKLIEDFPKFKKACNQYDNLRVIPVYNFNLKKLKAGPHKDLLEFVMPALSLECISMINDEAYLEQTPETLH